ncbi:MAG TPA: hypothetical protein VIG47_15510, partial [Gemmatimonadaceae bacterium]
MPFQSTLELRRSHERIAPLTGIGAPLLAAIREVRVQKLDERTLFNRVGARRLAAFPRSAMRNSGQLYDVTFGKIAIDHY